MNCRRIRAKSPVAKFKAKDYLDRWINPPEKLEAEAKKRATSGEDAHATPARPTRDVLLYLLQHARLEDWQAGLPLHRPRGKLLLRPAGDDQGDERRVGQLLAQHADDQAFRRAHEIIDYADHHSGTVHMPPGNFNPYKIGIELFRDIEDRWNKGKFGKEYDEADNLGEKKNGTRAWAWAGRRFSKSGGSTTT
jgi:stage V sporulation protein R